MCKLVAQISSLMIEKSHLYSLGRIVLIARFFIISIMQFRFHFIFLLSKTLLPYLFCLFNESCHSFHLKSGGVVLVVKTSIFFLMKYNLLLCHFDPFFLKLFVYIYFYFRFGYITCMQNFWPYLRILSNHGLNTQKKLKREEKKLRNG